MKGALLCSGMYDLKPVRLSKRSQYVAFTDEVEEKLSSMRHLDRLNCPLIVAYGTYETPEFQRQARDFAAAVKKAGKPVTLLVGEGYNHFEMAGEIGNPLSFARQRGAGADGTGSLRLAFASRLLRSWRWLFRRRPRTYRGPSP